MNNKKINELVFRRIFIGYFTVSERVRFLFTSCVKQTNERSE